MERVSRFRASLLMGLFGLIMLLYAMRLFTLQIIDTKGNTDNTTTYSTVTTVRAARGDILDRNGKVLVGNRASYDLVFNHFVIKSADNRNEYLYTLLKKCEELGVEHLDHFPVTMQRPFEYTLDDYNTAWQGYFHNFMVDWGLDPDVTAPLLIEKLRARYKLPEEWSDDDARNVIGLRYEFDLRGVTSLPSYVFIQDVSSENLSAILELNTPGLMVESSTVREYHTTYGAHILGYMGGMDDDDWAKYKDQGYAMDAYIGQAGFEEAFEEYLHGIDGTRLDRVTKDGTIVERKYLEGKEPIAGNNVETTIDISIQKVAEDSLAALMKDLVNPEINTGGDGLDAEGAAVVVMKVKTGEILACASYPSYDLANLNRDWDEIEADPLKPFFNRSFGAYYAPGSTFKMCTLTAAMMNKNSKGEIILKPGEIIKDEGVFTGLGEGFNPKCLFYSSTQGGSTHGDLTAEDALKVSCNFFFYELGNRMTWQMVDETAKGFGLGEPTGIELANMEKTGWRNNPTSKAASHTGIDATWNAGDRVLGAIGQAENRYTPLQLCVYACTLANRGTRYKATFLNRVASSDYRTLIRENKPEVVSKMEISYETYNTYLEGMRRVITYPGGTANKYFGGKEDPDPFPVNVVAKTGTAEHASGGSDHGAFVCFAPMENPEIAVAIYGEKVAHGSTLAPVAEAVLKMYFEMASASDVFTYENQIA